MCLKLSIYLCSFLNKLKHVKVFPIPKYFAGIGVTAKLAIALLPPNIHTFKTLMLIEM